MGLKQLALLTCIVCACRCGQPAPNINASTRSGPAPSAALESAPLPPSDLVRFHTGASEDSKITLGSGALIVMGGGTDVDEAFQWASQTLPGADVVILRASGSDGYNDYLYTDVGGFNSVETLLVTTRALAEDPYVAHQVAHAEIIFMAGGDQATYVSAWSGTTLAQSVSLAFARGAIVGGTSAGAMVLGDPIFAAQRGGVSSAAALANPFDEKITLAASMFRLLPNTIVDTHFRARDRAGRLLTFLARSDADQAKLRGIGIDEHTALVIGADMKARVLGTGRVLVLAPLRGPEEMKADQPLRYLGVPAQWLSAEDGTIDFASFAPANAMSCGDGICEGP